MIYILIIILIIGAILSVEVIEIDSIQEQEQDQKQDSISETEKKEAFDLLADYQQRESDSLQQDILEINAKYEKLFALTNDYTVSKKIESEKSKAISQLLKKKVDTIK